MIHDSLADAIGETPILRLRRYMPNGKATLLAKLECFNPYSIKDRAALFMIEDAVSRGLLRPGGTIVEATSGNTGIALAMLSAQRGFRCVLVMSAIQSQERRATLRALGAELILTPAEGGTKAARERAKVVAEERGAFYVGQHDNAANARAHAETTAEEIWRQTGGAIDAFVTPLGTGGTITGVGRRLHALDAGIRTFGVEPRESPFLSKGVFRPHRMMGTAPGFLPGVLDRGQVDAMVLVSEDEAFETCRELARTEGLLVGISSGASVFAAAQLARDPAWVGKTILCMICDSGERYLSVDGLFLCKPS